MRTEEENKMDARELHYDADGGFVLVDINRGLMGVYNGPEPIRHIWKERLRHIRPGLYVLAIHDDYIELFTKDGRPSCVIYLDDEDIRFFLCEVENNIPVLVY